MKRSGTEKSPAKEILVLVNRLLADEISPLEQSLSEAINPDPLSKKAASEKAESLRKHHTRQFILREKIEQSKDFLKKFANKSALHAVVKLQAWLRMVRIRRRYLAAQRFRAQLNINRVAPLFRRWKLYVQSVYFNENWILRKHLNKFKRFVDYRKKQASRKPAPPFFVTEALDIIAVEDATRHISRPLVRFSDRLIISFRRRIRTLQVMFVFRQWYGLVLQRKQKIVEMRSFMDSLRDSHVKDLCRKILNIWNRYVKYKAARKASLPPPQFTGAYHDHWRDWEIQYERRKALDAKLRANATMQRVKRLFSRLKLYYYAKQRQALRELLAKDYYLNTIVSNVFYYFRYSALQTRADKHWLKKYLRRWQMAGKKQKQQKKLLQEVWRRQSRILLVAAFRVWKRFWCYKRTLYIYGNHKIMEHYSLGLRFAFMMKNDVSSTVFLSCWNAWVRPAKGRLLFEYFLYYHIMRQRKQRLRYGFHAFRMNWLEKRNPELMENYQLPTYDTFIRDVFLGHHMQQVFEDIKSGEAGVLEKDQDVLNFIQILNLKMTDTTHILKLNAHRRRQYFRRHMINEWMGHRDFAFAIKIVLMCAQKLRRAPSWKNAYDDMTETHLDEARTLLKTLKIGSVASMSNYSHINLEDKISQNRIRLGQRTTRDAQLLNKYVTRRIQTSLLNPKKKTTFQIEEFKDEDSKSQNDDDSAESDLELGEEEKRTRKMRLREKLSQSVNYAKNDQHGVEEYFNLHLNHHESRPFEINSIHQPASKKVQAHQQGVPTVTISSSTPSQAPLVPASANTTPKLGSNSPTMLGARSTSNTPVLKSSASIFLRSQKSGLFLKQGSGQGSPQITAAPPPFEPPKSMSPVATSIAPPKELEKMNSFCSTISSEQPRKSIKDSNKFNVVRRMVTSFPPSIYRLNFRESLENVKNRFMYKQIEKCRRFTLQDRLSERYRVIKSLNNKIAIMQGSFFSAASSKGQQYYHLPKLVLVDEFSRALKIESMDTVAGSVDKRSRIFMQRYLNTNRNVFGHIEEDRKAFRRSQQDMKKRYYANDVEDDPDDPSYYNILERSSSPKNPAQSTIGTPGTRMRALGTFGKSSSFNVGIKLLAPSPAAQAKENASPPAPKPESHPIIAAPEVNTSPEAVPDAPKEVKANTPASATLKPGPPRPSFGSFKRSDTKPLINFQMSQGAMTTPPATIVADDADRNSGERSGANTPQIYPSGPPPQIMAGDFPHRSPALNRAISQDSLSSATTRSELPSPILMRQLSSVADFISSPYRTAATPPIPAPQNSVSTPLSTSTLAQSQPQHQANLATNASTPILQSVPSRSPPVHPKAHTPPALPAPSGPIPAGSVSNMVFAGANPSSSLAVPGAAVAIAQAKSPAIHAMPAKSPAIGSATIGTPGMLSRRSSSPLMAYASNPGVGPGLPGTQATQPSHPMQAMQGSYTPSPTLQRRQSIDVGGRRGSVTKGLFMKGDDASNSTSLLALLGGSKPGSFSESPNPFDDHHSSGRQSARSSITLSSDSSWAESDDDDKDGDREGGHAGKDALFEEDARTHSSKSSRKRDRTSGLFNKKAPKRAPRSTTATASVAIVPTQRDAVYRVDHSFLSRRVDGPQASDEVPNIYNLVVLGYHNPVTNSITPLIPGIEPDSEEARILIQDAVEKGITLATRQRPEQTLTNKIAQILNEDLSTNASDPSPRSSRQNSRPGSARPYDYGQRALGPISEGSQSRRASAVDDRWSDHGNHQHVRSQQIDEDYLPEDSDVQSVTPNHAPSEASQICGTLEQFTIVESKTPKRVPNKKIVKGSTLKTVSSKPPVERFEVVSSNISFNSELHQKLVTNQPLVPKPLSPIPRRPASRNQSDRPIQDRPATPSLVIENSFNVPRAQTAPSKSTRAHIPHLAGISNVLLPSRKPLGLETNFVLDGTNQ